MTANPWSLSASQRFREEPHSLLTCEPRYEVCAAPFKRGEPRFELGIEYRDPKELKAAPVNARTHSTKQISQIAQSIRSFGFNNPVLLDSSEQIIAGHGRVAAAINLGMEAVPTVRLDHLNPAQKRAYLIADNRLAELAGWDEEILAVELQGLLELDLDFDISDIGFELPEIDLMMEAQRQEKSEDSVDDLAGLENLPSIARPGDLWKLGEHLLFCGDALDKRSYQVLLGGAESANGFHRPSLQCPDRRPCVGSRTSPPRRISNGVRRNGWGSVYRVPAH